jgi:phage tail-like protein
MPSEGVGSGQDTDGYPVPAFHFEVELTGDGAGDDTSFQEVSGIGAELDVEAFAEGGENRFVHQLPKAVRHPKLVLKRGVAKLDSSLVQWCKDILEMDYIQKIETRDVSVRLLDQAHQPLRAWSFLNAYPVSWDVESFNSTKNEAAIEKIELVYSFSQRTM